MLVGFSKLKKVLGLGLVGFVPFSEKFSVGVSRFWQYFQKVLGFGVLKLLLKNIWLYISRLASKSGRFFDGRF